ncbi:MAG: SDR family oxidoreductase [Planctomycetia bacterium]|nr:SDR family oxidoreductase [Planctomycetia bacterium]
MTLTGKTALVTGGGTGIGLGIAQALAGEGCRVIVSGRREETLKQAAATMQGASYRTVDVGDWPSVEAMFASVHKEFGPLDILVNSAGTNTARRTLGELSLEDWDAMMKINCYGSFYCLRAAVPEMIKRKDGLIVNINSVSGIRAGLLGGIGYNASKFAVTGLGITAAQEVAEHGIRVTNVYPGEVDTPILEKRPKPVTAEHRARILKPEDVGAAVLMICKLPPRAHIPELTIKPIGQMYI